MCDVKMMYGWLGLFLASWPAAAWAGDGAGKIGRIWVSNDAPVVLFNLTTEINDAPRCNELGRFAIDLRRPGGSASYEALLAAKGYDLPVRVRGLNTCRAYHGAEDVKELVVE